MWSKAIATACLPTGTCTRLGTWPTKTFSNESVFILHRPLIILWQIQVPLLLPDLLVQHVISEQKLWYNRPGNVPTQAGALTQDFSIACILPWKANALQLVSI